jgi:hypothetical protein
MGKKYKGSILPGLIDLPPRGKRTWWEGKIIKFFGRSQPKTIATVCNADLKTMRKMKMAVAKLLDGQYCIECPQYTIPVYIIEARREIGRWQPLDIFYSQKKMNEYMKIYCDGDKKWPVRRPFQYRTRIAWMRKK